MPCRPLRWNVAGLSAGTRMIISARSRGASWLRHAFAAASSLNVLIESHSSAAWTLSPVTVGAALFDTTTHLAPSTTTPAQLTQPWTSSVEPPPVLSYAPTSNIVGATSTYITAPFIRCAAASRSMRHWRRAMSSPCSQVAVSAHTMRSSLLTRWALAASTANGEVSSARAGDESTRTAAMATNEPQRRVMAVSYRKCCGKTTTIEADSDVRAVLAVGLAQRQLGQPQGDHQGQHSHDRSGPEHRDHALRHRVGEHRAAGERPAEHRREHRHEHGHPDRPADLARERRGAG